MSAVSPTRAIDLHFRRQQSHPAVLGNVLERLGAFYHLRLRLLIENVWERRVGMSRIVRRMIVWTLKMLLVDRTEVACANLVVIGAHESPGNRGVGHWWSARWQGWMSTLSVLKCQLPAVSDDRLVDRDGWMFVNRAEIALHPRNSCLATQCQGYLKPCL
jgi:hypothetical protein